jgi:hypothetical protein
MEAQPLLEKLIADVQTVSSTVKQIAAEHSELLEKQPSPTRWSIKNCIEHLNLTAAIYVPRMEARIKQALDKKQAPANLFKPGFIGKQAVTGMLPNEQGAIPKPMKTFKMFDPYRQPKADANYLQNFATYQQQLVDLLTKAKNVDINKNRVNSAIGPIVRFKLGDAFRFVIAHELRHLQQMKNTLDELVR